ncbi:hypothetical protein ACIBG8_48295 [Nonomuraea sp. NPDC050556]
MIAMVLLVVLMVATVAAFELCMRSSSEDAFEEEEPEVQSAE